mmetsp:Transcript_19800/g.38782  ORF Transcript_19800/g.38782 Transcript_19800/m.38782 type:complete len:274 (-) Transcript_19800:73-894(-)
MSSPSVFIAFPFVSMSELRSSFIDLQAALALSHSSCVSSSLALNSLSIDSNVSNISPERNLYSGSSGSTPCCRNACNPFCFAACILTILRASASAMLVLTSSRTASKAAPPLAFFKALIALSSESVAFVRSATSASNFAISASHLAVTSSNSAFSATCFSFRSPNSFVFFALSATPSSMDADNSSILSWLLVISPDLSFVLSLQKQANLSYVLASSLPSVSTFVFRSSRSVITFAMGVTLAACAAVTATSSTTRPRAAMPRDCNVLQWPAASG